MREEIDTLNKKIEILKKEKEKEKRENEKVIKEKEEIIKKKEKEKEEIIKKKEKEKEEIIKEKEAALKEIDELRRQLQNLEKGGIGDVNKSAVEEQIKIAFIPNEKNGGRVEGKKIKFTKDSYWCTIFINQMLSSGIVKMFIYVIVDVKRLL
jgi:DNA repair exonuclease SbcCD ATPase subunit